MMNFFPFEVPLLYFEWFFNAPFILVTWVRRLYFPSWEGVLRVFIALKNPSPSAEFEHANLRSNGKHGYH
jgi:hypothetical protein